MITVSLFFKVFPLEMQRRIVNEAISLRDLELLYLYCGLYIGAVIVAGLFKYFINTFQAIIGQKLLIGMRRELYEHILQLPLTFFHRTQSGTIISAMTGELSAIGNFLGGAIAVPTTALLTFGVLAGYMIALNPLLGFISMLVYPFELVVIPILQRHHNRVNRTRVTTIREMANLVNEATAGIHEVQENAGFALERSKLDGVIDRLYKIVGRLAILKVRHKVQQQPVPEPRSLPALSHRWLYGHQWTVPPSAPWSLFSLPYEKVYDPWKELIEYYQGYQDAHVRYRQIMEAFDIKAERLLEHRPESVQHLKGNIEVRNISYHASGGVQLLNDISLSLAEGEHMALVGFSGSGKSTLSFVLGALYKPSEGDLLIDGNNAETLSREDIAANISFVSQHPFIFTGTVRENLLYSSNALHLSGLKKEVPDTDELIKIIADVGLTDDIMRWGLSTTLPADTAFELAGKFLHMREITRQEVLKRHSNIVELYDPHRFLNYSSLAINIVFSSYKGTPSLNSLMDNQPFRLYLKHSGLHRELVMLGFQIARHTIDFLGDLRGDDFFFPRQPDHAGKF